MKPARRARLSSLVLVLAGIICFAGAASWNSSHVAAESPDTADGGLSGAAVTEDPGGIVVQYEPGTSDAAIAALEASLGIDSDVLEATDGLRVLPLDDPADLSAVLAALQQSGLVAQAAPDRIATAFEVPDDPGYPLQWDLHGGAGGVNAEAAWDLATNRGAGVTVAVIDTGVAYESNTRPGIFGTATFAPAPDLAGVPIVSPWNYIADDAHPDDDHGHGTHVAGTILEQTNNGQGAAGMASDASLMPIKILDFSGQGNGSDIVDAIYYAVDHGANVINMSLGFPDTGTPDASGQYCTEILGLGPALDYADTHGVTVVAAAGNEGASTVSCPAAYPTVIAVGATRYDGAVTSYSNTGATLDVTAPGGDPNVDQNGDGVVDGITQETYCLDGVYLLFTGNYTQFCNKIFEGTSMASPHVAGVAALLLGESPGLSPAQVRYYLETTARDEGAPGWDPQYGAGLIDAGAAVALVQGTDPPVFTPTPTPSVSPTPFPTATPTATPVPPPAAPTDLTATLTGITTVKLTWTDNATNEQYYSVERSTDGVNYSQVALVLAGTTNWTNYVLAAGTEFSFRVRAQTGSLYSAYSNVVTATTGDAPAAPSDLHVTATTESSISLAWTDNSDNEQFFIVERSTDGSSWSSAAYVGSNTTSWTNSGLAPSTTYQYRVRANVSNLYSPYTSPVSASTSAEPPPPAAPSSLVLTPQGPDAARLDWTDNATDEQYFRVERSTDGVSYSQVALLLANTTSWTNYGLAPATTYFYRVRASAGSRYSGYSNSVSVTTAGPPAAPSNLVAVALSPTSVRLAWTDNSSDEQYFRIERSLDGVSYSQAGILLANNTSWTDYSLQPETSYTYRVRASAGSAYSAYTPPATVTTFGPPSAPTSLETTVLGPSSIRLDWTDNATTEQNYYVERSPDGSSFTQVAQLSANTVTWTSTLLTAETTYWFRVRAGQGGTYSSYSNTASATTDDASSTSIVLVATAVDAGKISLTWNDNVDGEQFWWIERSTNGTNFSVISLQSANTTSWSNGSLSANTQYWYRVRTSTSGVYGTYSNVATAITLPPPAAPSGLTLTIVGTTAVKLAWQDNSSNEQYFRLERSTDGITFSQAGIVLANTTSWTFYGLTPGTTYWYRVRATAGSAVSDPSNAASITIAGP